MNQLDKVNGSSSARNRRRGRRALAAAAVLAVGAGTAAVNAASYADSAGNDNAGSASRSPAAVGERRVTYAEGSTIHYGGQEIDVSPHKMMALVQTDDGFVFVDQDRTVLFTDGDRVDELTHVGEFTGDLVLAADDTGSYVGWIEDDEAMVYDTATRTEVLHEALPGRDVRRAFAAIDGDKAYVEYRRRVVVWDLTDNSRTTITRPNPNDELGDVANGYYLWHHPNGTSVVSRDPQGQRPVFRQIIGQDEEHLSPTAKYVAGTFSVFERATGRDVTPAHNRRHEVITQWLGRDRYVADTRNMHTAGTVDPHKLVTCSISAGTCRVAVRSLGRINYPDGIAHEGAWQG